MLIRRIWVSISHPLRIIASLLKFFGAGAMTTGDVQRFNFYEGVKVVAALLFHLLQSPTRNGESRAMWLLSPTLWRRRFSLKELSAASLFLQHTFKQRLSKCVQVLGLIARER